MTITKSQVQTLLMGLVQGSQLVAQMISSNRQDQIDSLGAQLITVAQGVIEAFPEFIVDNPS